MIGPDKKLKLSILYPATTGRNFDEIIRAIDSLQLTARRKVATPVDWRQGGQVIVAPSVKPEDAPGLFPKGVKVHELPSGKVQLFLFLKISLLNCINFRATSEQLPSPNNKKICEIIFIF